MLKILLMNLFLILMFYKKKNYLIFNSLIIIFFFQFFYSYLNYSNLSYFFGIDKMSYLLIFLSFWIMFMMLLVSEVFYYNKNNEKLFSFIVILLSFFLVLSFSSLSLFGFYIFFESSLVFTLLLILGWGYQPERLQAGVYMLFYTLIVSLPLLIMIMFLYKNNNLYYFFFYKVSLLNYLMYFSMILAFLVKMPMFLVHLWLPKAHVEAPVSGSMILAGVMLKLGGYGLIRIMEFFLILSKKINFIWMLLSFIGGILVSLICLMQIDLKALVAYSSVVHMSILLIGLMSLNMWGIIGSLKLMIGHGLCSSGLFCLVSFSYERSNSRSLLINKGMMNFMPSLCFWWFLLSSSNMAAPPSMNLLGEISLLNSIMGWCSSSMLFLMMISFFSASYSLYLYSYSQHGEVYSGMFSFSKNFISEYLILFLHWLPLNMLFMKSDLFLLI
uniref:NADH-ubiquinone oxidoreductase chain 4 n=1 Tax=Mongoloraphidia harmandi TaxID=633873 RepID=C8YXC5_9NEOP|nr:NADH dehydrogenase subunit 4 [Mongoloraphidia harmandi]ACO92559.1 NADH dehydrogenase subunit 4 [Mongoloraphidia harmandi]